MEKISVAICTGMGLDLTDLLESLLKTDCTEILVIGTEGRSFISNTHLDNPRVRTLYTAHPINAKRNLALEEASNEIISFVDDDAVVCPTWFDALRSSFDNPEVGIVTGPSLLADDATFWERTAQLAMGSSPYSMRRYNPFKKELTDWYNVIGANMAFRKKALLDAGGWPKDFPEHGEDMAIAHRVCAKGWLLLYSPKVAVYHPPHSFRKQVVQIHRWGRAAKRLKRAGIVHPKRDPAYYFYIPVLLLFSLSYVFGEIKETLIYDIDIRIKKRLRAFFRSAS